MTMLSLDLTYIPPPPLDLNSIYISTSTGNFVSRNAHLYGSQNIHLKGKVILMCHMILRGDFAQFKVGKYTILSCHVILHPSCKPLQNQMVAFFPLSIGSHVFIANGVLSQAASIGSCVYIGKDAIVGKRVIIRDNVYIEEGTIIPDDTLLPPFSAWAGKPGVQIGQVNVAWMQGMVQFTTLYYERWKTQSDEKEKDLHNVK